MKLSDLLQLHTALTSLSGSVTHLNDGKPVQTFFRFTGATRLGIARAIRSLGAFAEDHKTAVVEIVKQHGGPWREPCEEQARAAEEIHSLELAEVSDAPSISLPLAEFTADDNPVSPSVLEVLLDYLK